MGIGYMQYSDVYTRDLHKMSILGFWYPRWGGGGGGESRGVSPLQIWADGLYCVEKLEKT